MHLKRSLYGIAAAVSSLLIFAPAVHAASFVQSASTSGTKTGSASAGNINLTATLGTGATVGNTIVAILGATGNTGATVTLNAPSGFTQVISNAPTGTANDTRTGQAIYYKVATGGETGISTSANFSADSGVASLQLYEFSNLGAPIASDFFRGTTTALDSGTISTTATNQLVLSSLMTINNNSTFGTWTGYTAGQTGNASTSDFGGTDGTFAGRYRVTSTTGTQHPTATGTNVAGFTGQIVAFGLDTTAPTVTNVTSSTTDGTYGLTQSVSIQVTFSEVVTVTGTPKLTLSTGSPATTDVNYVSGSGTNVLTFTYTVASGNFSSDLDYASVSALSAGTSIKDAAGNDAVLALASPGAANSLGNNKALVIDAVGPILLGVTPIVSVTTDTTPSYVFSSDEAGDISYGGPCAAYVTGSISTASASNNTVTFDVLPGGSYAGCTVKVTDASGNESNVLTIPTFYVWVGGSGGGGNSAPSVTVVSPNGGETFAGGSAVNLLWSYGGSQVVGTRLSWSANNGSSWTVISPNVDAGNYSWIVPMVGTEQGLLKAEVMLGGETVGAEDVSDAVFTVTVPPGTVVENPDESVSEPGNSDYVPADKLAASPDINTDKGLNSLTPPTGALCISGSLIKLPNDNNPLTTIDSTVYFCGNDGKRYVFPNVPTFHTWFADYSGVVEVSAETLAQIPLGGNITYRPGSRMVKLTTDNKVYAVDNGGVLRWVTSEQVAERLYGSGWAGMIDDLADTFMVDYTIGAPII